jgi:hypothetical protein
MLPFLKTDTLFPLEMPNRELLIPGSVVGSVHFFRLPFFKYTPFIVNFYTYPSGTRRNEMRIEQLLRIDAVLFRQGVVD